ncbi:NAD-dependent epimerase/dehydratase family protein [Nonomuraea longicatena]|uniref:NAD-dependent epimerase/dehydratase family protein n=1 Tax=Nonomuraea longicatena TaxID=83682 RepID=A0ABP3ZGA4_9ACTN
MRLLILGGTWFLGRAVAELAIERGHDVTTFTRGRSGTDVPGTVPVRGDRTSGTDLTRLAGTGSWDAVVDTSGMTPAMVETAAVSLAEAVAFYVFTSTVNVFQGWPLTPLDDASPLRVYTPDGPAGESVADRYGREKVGAEQAVTRSFPGRAALLRPGVIVGPYEYVGRIPWWLRRLARGGRVLAPGTPDQAIQPIDVRDVATFALDTAEEHRTGSFNLAAPIGSATFGGFLGACRQAVGSDAHLEWVEHDFLIHHKVREWVELPLWRPYAGTWALDAERARTAGLTCRPLATSVADTWTWLTGTGQLVDHERAAELGIAAEREAELLAAWDARYDPAGSALTVLP